MFLKRAFSYDNPFVSTQVVINWVKEQNDKISVEIKKIPFKNLKLCGFDEHKSILKHEIRKI